MSSLAIHSSLHVKELTLPTGAVAVGDVEQPVVTVVPPSVEAAPGPVAEAAPDAAAAPPAGEPAAKAGAKPAAKPAAPKPGGKKEG